MCTHCSSRGDSVNVSLTHTFSLLHLPPVRQSFRNLSPSNWVNVCLTHTFSLLRVPIVSHFPKSSKAASLLLYSMWSDKDLQSVLKKVR